MKKSNKKWYSIIIIIIIIWFLTVLTTWVFNLVLNENKDSKTLWDYIKTYAWAESWQELALLWIKEIWYPYILDLEKNKEILNNCDNPNKCLNISFKNNWKTSKYEWKLLPYKTDIIPLFYLDKDWSAKWISNISLKWTNISDISWNFVWTKYWIWWSWAFNQSTFWEGSIEVETSPWEYESKFLKEKIETFLYYAKNFHPEVKNKNSEPYLILYNAWNSEINYILEETSGEQFVSPELTIISNWEFGNYKTNIETIVNLEQLNSRSKYSIFSPE